MNVRVKLFATLTDYLPPAGERKGNEVALDVPAAKYNDDRLGRSLDALSQHAQAI